MSPLERLGILGGTFDPPHIGHLVAAVSAFHSLGVDRVLLMVANAPWQKLEERRITPVATRLEMVRQAVAGHRGLEASDFEARLGGESSTVVTLEALTQQVGLTERPYVILGADAAAGLATWRRVEDLPALARLAIVERPGTPAVGIDWPEPPVVVPMPRLDVSSSDLRRRVAAGEPIDYLVPDPVAQMIEDRLLYRVGS